MPDATQQRLSVINEAFLGLKAASIQGFDDEVEGVEDIERKYLTVVRSLLAHPSFNYSIQRVALVRQTATVGMAYNYTSPVGGDVLAVFDDATTQTPYTQFAMLAGKINTDLEAAWAEVMVDAEPDAWPAYVRRMVVACLEAEFAFDLTGDLALARHKRQIAYGPPMVDPNGGLVGDARSRAGQQQGGGRLVMGENDLTLARYR